MADDPSNGSARDNGVTQNGITPRDESAPDTPPRADPYEGAVPPGYDWPTHGGYLGCLLSLIVACLVGGFLGSTFFSALSHLRILPLWAAGALTVAVFIGCIAGLGRLGWVLGRRFYREYPQPHRPVWGEDDEPDDATKDAPEDPAFDQPAPGEQRRIMP